MLFVNVSVRRTCTETDARRLLALPGFIACLCKFQQWVLHICHNTSRISVNTLFSLRRYIHLHMFLCFAFKIYCYYVFTFKDYIVQELVSVCFTSNSCWRFWYLNRQQPALELHNASCISFIMLFSFSFRLGLIIIFSFFQVFSCLIYLIYIYYTDVVN